MFIHNTSPEWPEKGFSVESIPEVTEFDGQVVNTSIHSFRSINEAFIYLWKADRVVIADSVFMWAAWALNKRIDYLHLYENNPKVEPMELHTPLIGRSNRMA